MGTGTGSQIFSLKPNKDEILIVDSLSWFIVDDYDGVTGQNGVMKLEWNKILGEILINGMAYQRFKDGDILYSINLRTISDWFTTPNTIIQNYSSDGTNTMMNIYYKFSEPYIMTDNDKIVLIVEDNLSGFIKFRTSANCKRLLGSTGNETEINNYGNLLSYGS
jgi:hypothetical protein